MTTQYATQMEEARRYGELGLEIPAASNDAASPDLGGQRHGVIKRWLRSGLCAVHMHGGTWAFVAERDCTQQKTCDHCATLSVRTKHRHEWRYTVAGTCAQAKECIRCSQVTDKRTKHEEWGETYSVGDERDAHRCLRCGKEETWSTASDD